MHVMVYRGLVAKWGHCKVCMLREKIFMKLQRRLGALMMLLFIN